MVMALSLIVMGMLMMMFMESRSRLLSRAAFVFWLADLVWLMVHFLGLLPW
jgi:hypothetical protein